MKINSTLVDYDIKDKINQNSLISISKHLFNIIRAKGKISGTNVSIQSY